MSRLYVTLRDEEHNALMKMASVELRDPRDQARLVIRQELVRRGYLKESQAPVSQLQSASQESKCGNCP